MKTNVPMIRKMGQFDVVQRTKDGYFNANVLLEQWNKTNSMKKEIGHFLSLKSTKEFIEVMEEKAARNHELPEHQAFKKSRASTDKKGKKTPGAYWFHPYLFIDFSMWINPKFKYDVIKFVYDQLIQYRHEAGDNYVQLSASLSQLSGIPPTGYKKVAVAMQWIVFDKKGTELRQTASQDQLNQLKELEKKLSFAIDMGYIETFDQLISEMRKLYQMKNKKF